MSKIEYKSFKKQYKTLIDNKKPLIELEDTLEELVYKYTKKCLDRYHNAQNLKLYYNRDKSNEIVKKEYSKLLIKYDTTINFLNNNDKFLTINNLEKITKKFNKGKKINVNFNKLFPKKNNKKINNTKKNNNILSSKNSNNNILKQKTFKIKSIKSSIKKSFKFNADDKTNKWNENNFHELYGLTNEEELKEFVNQYSKLGNKIYKELKKINNIIKKKYGSDALIHTSNNIIDLKTFKPKRGNIWGKFIDGDFYYNPFGFWFACGTAWIDRFTMNKGNKKYKDIINIVNNEHLKQVRIKMPRTWGLRYIYILDTHKLNIKSINNCEEMKAFEAKYYNPKAKTLNELLDWNRIYKDYDGIKICPYLKTKCVNKFVLNKYERFDEKQAILLGIKDGIKQEDFTGLWANIFDAASGVIWKNYRNLNLIRVL